MSTWEYTAGATDPVSLLRLQLADTDFSSVGDEVPQGQRSALFSDQEYQALLAMANGDVTVALINALRTIARNRAILAVAVSLGGGGNVDFTRMSAQLLQQAESLWQWYCELPAEAYAEEDFGFFSANRIFWNSLLRSAAY